MPWGPFDDVLPEYWSNGTSSVFMEWSYYAATGHVPNADGTFDAEYAKAVQVDGTTSTAPTSGPGANVRIYETPDFDYDPDFPPPDVVYESLAKQSAVAISPGNAVYDYDSPALPPGAIDYEFEVDEATYAGDAELTIVTWEVTALTSFLPPTDIQVSLRHLAVAKADFDDPQTYDDSGAEIWSASTATFDTGTDVVNVADFCDGTTGEFTAVTDLALAYSHPSDADVRDAAGDPITGGAASFAGFTVSYKLKPPRVRFLFPDTVAIPVRRVYPRGDGRTFGAGRVLGARSQQSSNRVGGAVYL